eukprot:4404023-Amphidinium_carterae.1
MESKQSSHPIASTQLRPPILAILGWCLLGNVSAKAGGRPRAHGSACDPLRTITKGLRVGQVLGIQ